MTSLSSGDLAKVVQLFLAVVDAADLPPEPHERQRAIQLARRWAPGEDAAFVEGVVDTAYVAARRGADVERLTREVCTKVSREECLQLLSDLGQIAKADGHLSLYEARVIARVRAVALT